MRDIHFIYLYVVIEKCIKYGDKENKQKKRKIHKWNVYTERERFHTWDRVVVGQWFNHKIIMDFVSHIYVTLKNYS